MFISGPMVVMFMLLPKVRAGHATILCSIVTMTTRQCLWLLRQKKEKHLVSKQGCHNLLYVATKQQAFFASLLHQLPRMLSCRECSVAQIVDNGYPNDVTQSRFSLKRKKQNYVFKKYAAAIIKNLRSI